MTEVASAAAATIRALVDAAAGPTAIRSALAAVPAADRDLCIDRLFDLEELPVDGPALPRGCVPYIPCGIDHLLRIAEHVQPSDVFVDVGAGVGRALVLMHLITGARGVGIEIQPAMVREARALIARFGIGASIVEGDAAELVAATEGSVYFLYCPFGGARLDKVLDDLEQVARTRPILICCVDLPLPPRGWLVEVVPATGGLAVFRADLSQK